MCVDEVPLMVDVAVNNSRVHAAERDIVGYAKLTTPITEKHYGIGDWNDTKPRSSGPVPMTSPPQSMSETTFAEVLIVRYLYLAVSSTYDFQQEHVWDSALCKIWGSACAPFSSARANKERPCPSEICFRSIPANSLQLPKNASS